MSWLSSLFRVALNFVLIGLGAAAFLLYFYQTKLIYPAELPPGSRVDVDKPSKYQMDYEDLTLTTKDGVKLRAYFIQGETNVTLLYLHANAGNMGHRLPVAFMLKRILKCNIFMLSYRGYGLSEGSPDEKGLKIDAETALEHLKNNEKTKNHKIIVYGQSIGGAVAVYLASKRETDVHALIVENTFLSLPRLVPSVFAILRYFTFLCHQIWPSEQLIKQIQKIPVLFLNGSQDELIPPWHTKQLRDILLEARSQGKSGSTHEEFSIYHKEFLGGTHNDTCLMDGYFDAIQVFWDKHKDD